MASRNDGLLELVRASKLQATISAKQTIHTRLFARQKYEIWDREQVPLGRGGYGYVWLERMRKIKEDGSPARGASNATPPMRTIHGRLPGPHPVRLRCSCRHASRCRIAGDERGGAFRDRRARLVGDSGPPSAGF